MQRNSVSIMSVAELRPIYLLGEDWETIKYVGLGGRYFGRRKLTEEEEKVMRWIRDTRIQIAGIAETVMISSRADHEYLKTELGMNIVLPKGTIEELRFEATLKGDGEVSKKVYAIDGFPNDIIEDKHIIQGQITLGVSKLFKLVPVVGDVLPDLELGPWKFALGRLRNVQVDFSGPKTPTPEWYFKADGIRNELRVTLTIAKHRSIQNIDAEVRCGWVYDPGIFSKIKVGTDEKTIQIYKQK